MNYPQNRRNESLRPTRYQWVILVCVVFLLAACGGANRFQKPKVSLESVTLKSVGLLSQTFLLCFNIENPNSYAIHVKDIHAELYLDGNRIAEAKPSSTLTLEGSSNAPMNLTARTRFLKSIVELADLKSRESLRYRVQGRITKGIGKGDADSVRFNVDGRIKSKNLDPN